MFYNPIRLRRVTQEYGPVRTLREQASTTPPHFVFPTSVPPRLPNLNAFAKRWIRSVKEEALSRMILFGERSLQHVLKEYEHHFHRERPRPAKENIILMPSARQAHSSGGQICCRERLGRDKTALMAPYEFGVRDMAPM